VDFEMAWRFPVPPDGAARMGRVGGRLYEIAQWYPRMAVYDDVRGWNVLPYIGAGEFYPRGLRRHATLPAGFLVAATGSRERRGGVDRERLARALEPPSRGV
jgi:hypothetical protein